MSTSRSTVNLNVTPEEWALHITQQYLLEKGCHQGALDSHLSPDLYNSVTVDAPEQICVLCHITCAHLWTLKWYMLAIS
jgi:hypothetical protein